MFTSLAFSFFFHKALAIVFSFSDPITTFCLRGGFVNRFELILQARTQSQ
jgi:hypothetical protein